MRELNCAILHTPYGYRSSAVEEVIHHGDLLGYDEKYIGKTEKQSINQKRLWVREEKLVEEVQKCSVAIARLFEIQGVARIDYLYDKGQEKLYVNELNTIPGLFILLFVGMGRCWIFTIVRSDHSRWHTGLS